MAAPKNPNPAAAAATRRKLGDATAANRLQAAGYVVMPPTEDKVRQALTALAPFGDLDRAQAAQLLDMWIRRSELTEDERHEIIGHFR